MMATWSKSRTLEFIEMYKSFECLWKMNSPDYNNRYLKDQAYQYLCERVAQFEPDANRELVTRKINSLRTVFRKEYKKVKIYGEDNYRPKLFYYDYLLFLKDEQPDESFIFKCEQDSSMSPTNNDRCLQPESYNLEIGFQEAEEQESNVSSLRIESADRFDHLDSSDEPAPKRLKTSLINQNNSSNHSMFHQSQLHQNSKVSNLDEPFEIIGQSIASKLKHLGQNQRILAERLIHEVIFEAEMGTLNRKVCLNGLTLGDGDDIDDS